MNVEGVILLHGLARTSRSMARLAAVLTEEGYVVVNVNYPSRTASIDTLSQAAIGPALIEARLGNCTRIHFITHSLGGILVRDYFARNPAIPRLGRVVMLGPPNRGSEVVDRLKSWRVFHWVNGPAGGELGTDPASTPNRLGPVHFELGVIAGKQSINWINSWMIRGPNDGKVSVENTKVDGMKDHLVVATTHPFMMRNPRVIAACLCFLRAGRFASE